MCCFLDADVFSPLTVTIALIVGVALAMGGMLSSRNRRLHLRARQCAACGLRNPHNARFCGGCGAPLPPPEPPPA